MAIDLNALFPGDGVRARKPVDSYMDNPVARGEYPGIGLTACTEDNVPTRWASICSFELRGLNKKEIAGALNMGYHSIIQITNDERYLAYRDKRLAALDNDFIAMKPLAFDALRNGLRSKDENVALRAAEQWFKGASFGGYSKKEQEQSSLTAEDVASALLNAVQVNVNVNVNSGQSDASGWSMCDSGRRP